MADDVRNESGIEKPGDGNLNFLNPRQVAELLGVHRITVYRWLASGKLPALHIGQQYFISEDVLRDLAKTKREQSSE